MSDDDWFERALRETEEAEDETESAADEAESAADGPEDGDGPDGSDTADGDDPGGAGDEDWMDERPGTDTDPFGGEGQSDADPFGGDDQSDADPFGGDDQSDADPFGGEGQSGTDPFGGEGQPDADPFGSGEPDASGMEAGMGAAGGETGTEGGDSPFSEDFASALESAPDPDGTGGPEAGGGFGMGGFPGSGEGTETFDDEEFESDIERIKVGIDGLDEMILGGVPYRSLMVSMGSAGTGKTTFGLQFLDKALSDGGRGVFITLEESRDRVIDTAEEKGWPFEEYIKEGRLVVLDLDPIEMANSLSSIRSDLPRLIDDFGADRLVLDSVSLLEMMYDHPSERRSEVFDFSRALKQAGVTTMLTSEASEDSPYVSRHGLIEYLADAVFILQYVRPDDFRETRLAVEIQKIRDANHSRETKPYEITGEGISVYRQANIF